MIHNDSLSLWDFLAEAVTKLICDSLVNQFLSVLVLINKVFISSFILTG